MTATAQQSTDRRECALYRFWVRHPATGRTVLGYVGETVRMPFVRLVEHVLAQPWADTIVRWEVDPNPFVGKPAVEAAERAAIEAERPLYNVEWNMGNPDRIKPWEAVAQRQAREPGWQPPVVKPRVPHPRGGARPSRAVRVPEWRQRLMFAGQIARWVGVVLFAGWVAAVAASGPVATWVDGLAYGVTLPTVLVCAPWSTIGRRVRHGVRRQRRRRSRR